MQHNQNTGHLLFLTLPALLSRSLLYSSLWSHPRTHLPLVSATSHKQHVLSTRTITIGQCCGHEARESAMVALAGKSLSEHRCHSSAMEHERYTITTREMRDVSCIILYVILKHWCSTRYHGHGDEGTQTLVVPKRRAWGCPGAVWVG